MRYAIASNDRVEPEYSGQKGECPFCGSDVVARCGDILADHWAHVDKSDCVGCSAPMTEWHKAWQDEFPKECQEVKVGDHRADVLIDGFVIEFQHSSLPGPQIKAREDAYKNMVWIIDVTESYPSFDNGVWQCSTGQLDRYYHLCKSPLFLEMGSVGVCLVHDFAKRGRTPEGNGELFERATLVERLRDVEWLRKLKPVKKDNAKQIKKRQKLEGKHFWGENSTGTVCVKGLAPVGDSQPAGLKRVKEVKQCGCVHKGRYVAEPDPRRPGWEKVFCGDCRKWIGNRPSGH